MKTWLTTIIVAILLMAGTPSMALDLGYWTHHISLIDATECSVGHTTVNGTEISASCESTMNDESGTSWGLGSYSFQLFYVYHQYDENDYPSSYKFFYNINSATLSAAVDTDVVGTGCTSDTEVDVQFSIIGDGGNQSGKWYATAESTGSGCDADISNDSAYNGTYSWWGYPTTVEDPMGPPYSYAWANEYGGFSGSGALHIHSSDMIVDVAVINVYVYTRVTTNHSGGPSASTEGDADGAVSLTIGTSCSLDI